VSRGERTKPAGPTTAGRQTRRSPVQTRWPGPLAAGRPRWPRRWPPGGTRRPPRQLAGQSGWPASLAAGRARLPSGHGGWPGRLARAVGRRPGYVGQGVGHPVEPVVHRRQLAGQSGWPASLAAGRRPGHVSQGLGHQGNGRPRSAVRWPRRLASVIGQGRWPPVEAPPLPFRFALARPLATGQGQPSAARRWKQVVGYGTRRPAGAVAHARRRPPPLTSSGDVRSERDVLCRSLAAHQSASRLCRYKP
jgi:hypothetical protein